MSLAPPSLLLLPQSSPLTSLCKPDSAAEILQTRWQETYRPRQHRCAKITPAAPKQRQQWSSLSAGREGTQSPQKALTDEAQLLLLWIPAGGGEALTRRCCTCISQSSPASRPRLKRSCWSERHRDRASSREPPQPRDCSAPTHAHCRRCLAAGSRMLHAPPGEESNKHSPSPGNAASCTGLLWSQLVQQKPLCLTARYRFSYFWGCRDFLWQLFLSPLESLVLQQDTGGRFLLAPAFVLPVKKKHFFFLIDGSLSSVFHFIKHNIGAVGKGDSSELSTARCQCRFIPHIHHKGISILTGTLTRT